MALERPLLVEASHNDGLFDWVRSLSHNIQLTLFVVISTFFIEFMMDVLVKVAWAEGWAEGRAEM